MIKMWGVRSEFMEIRIFQIRAKAQIPFYPIN